MYRLGLLVMFSVLCTVQGEVNTYMDVNPCDGKMSFEAAIDNDVLYNQVYNWMHYKITNKLSY